MDTVRADALNCYNLPLPAANTPNIDRLAANGTLYSRAACNIPATLTSHTAILTGRLPRSTGVRFAKDQVSKPIETLAETLKMEGFSTSAFLSSAVLNKMYGLDQGFDVYEDLSETSQIEAERSAEKTTNLALKWIEQRKSNESYFIWVHYYDAHSPYHPPKEYDHYGYESYSGVIDGSANQVSKLVASKGEGTNEDDLNRLRSLYLGEVEYMDHHIGRLIDGFDSNSDDGNNMVVALADHGENLGEHGRYFHGADLYGQSMHIPLIIRWGKEQNKGTTVSELVQSIDVAPTILSACGIFPPPNIEGVDLGQWFDENENRIKRTALLENEDEYRSDADKLFAAENLSGKLVDTRFQRRSPVLVGRSVQLELTDSCFLQAWIKGDASVEVVSQIRFHTNESWDTKNEDVMSKLPTIMVRTSRYGFEAIHYIHPPNQELTMRNHNWERIASPDLYERALSYGNTQGWQFDRIVLESIALDAAGIPGQTRLDIWVDDIELKGKQSVMLDNFEYISSKPYQDAGVGTKKAAGSQIENNSGLDDSKALHAAVIFEPDENLWDYTEYHQFDNYLQPYNEENQLDGLAEEAFPQNSIDLAQELSDWINRKAGSSQSIDTIDKAQEEKLKSLGYF